MNDLLKKLAGLDTKNTRVLKENINEWGGDPATLPKPHQGAPDRDPDEERWEELDSWSDAVETELAQYHIKGTLSPDQIEELSEKIADDIGCSSGVAHTLVKNILDQRASDAEAEPDHDMDQEYSSDLDEASIADIPADVLAKGAAEIEAGADCYDVLNKLNKETGRKYMDQFKSLIRGAQNDAHMEYDTQGGDITPFLLDTMKGLAARGDSAGAQGDVGGAHGEETISPIHGGQKEEPTMENLNLESLRYLSGINKTVNECGIPTAMGASTPASINITAASGSELTGMLKDIMNLAGVHKVEPHHMPIDVLAAPSVAPAHADAGPDMATLIKAVGDPEADTDSMNDREEETDESSGEKEENRPWDTSPHEKIRQDGVRKFGDQNSGSGKGRTGIQPNAHTTESIAEQLYADYKAFVAEAAADEPAAPDADAIAKRKRLQAIKDRQEDERAEKAYKTDSNVRVHHAKYDNDVDEGYDTRDAYEKCDPKHPDFKKNYEKYKAANPTGTLADFVAKMKRK